MDSRKRDNPSPQNSSPRRVWLAQYPPLAELLAEVERNIHTLVKAEENPLAEGGEYAVSGRGKRLRPALLLLVAEACGGANARATEAAAVVEVLHTASLVHDDVVDEAASRRGKASLRALWGNKISVLLGDFLLCRAVSHFLKNGNAAMTGELFAVAEQMCRGQVAEIGESGPGLTEARYLNIVAHKTAALFEFCGRLGADCASAPPPVIESFGEFARNFGLAFQITDDIHDLVGAQEVSGKPTNHDLRQRKVTLPLIYCLREAEAKTRASLQAMLSTPTPSEDNLVQAAAIAEACGGIAYAWGISQAYLRAAQTALESAEKQLAYSEASAAGRQALEVLKLSCTENFPLPVMS